MHKIKHNDKIILFELNNCLENNHTKVYIYNTFSLLKSN